MTAGGVPEGGLGACGRYELLKKLAVGGMGEIFLARQAGPEGFSKLVVIKRILPGLASQERFVQMFLDEARVAAGFNHPNIIQIFDLGREKDFFYIAMEHIQGEDLKAVVRRAVSLHRRIPIEHVCRIFCSVLDGLHYAHCQKSLDGLQTGIVHRDVSPNNVLVSFQGGVKLVDFGIAKARSEMSTTIPGRVKGKHAYMSPEQVFGEPLDGRSDVFSVGIVMYELLSWTRLFKRKTHLDTLRAVTDEKIRPLQELAPAIDRELAQIVHRALERDLKHRYQTAQAMQIDLEEYLRRSGLPSNSVLLAQFMNELFSQKLQAREKALTQARAVDLEGVVLKATETETNLGAFLDVFFEVSAPPRDAPMSDSDAFEDLNLGLDLPSKEEEARGIDGSPRPSALPYRPNLVEQPPEPALPPAGMWNSAPHASVSSVSVPSQSAEWPPPEFLAQVPMPGEFLPGSGNNRVWIVVGVVGLVALLGLWKLGSGKGESADERSPPSPKASKVQDAVAPVAPSEAQRPRGSIVAGLEGQGRGTLRVESQPPGAQIYLDGIQTGKKTPASLSVAVGLEHVILLELDGYAPGIERFQGEAAGKVNLSLPRSQKTLEGRRTVRFETKPAGASVIINGYPMQAKTPMAASLLVWTYSDIDIELGRKRRELKVRPVADCDLTIFVKLD